jgi:hypothetical protein
MAIKPKAQERQSHDAGHTRRDLGHHRIYWNLDHGRLPLKIMFDNVKQIMDVVSVFETITKKPK